MITSPRGPFLAGTTALWGWPETATTSVMNHLLFLMDWALAPGTNDDFLFPNTRKPQDF
jgi:hypothetical protein